MDAAHECVVVRPPSADEGVWIGLCESIGVWRLKVPPFDAHGVIDESEGLLGFDEALSDAILIVREERPDLADELRSLRDGLHDQP